MMPWSLLFLLITTEVSSAAEKCFKNDFKGGSIMHQLVLTSRLSQTMMQMSQFVQVGNFTLFVRFSRPCALFVGRFNPVNILNRALGLRENGHFLSFLISTAQNNHTCNFVFVPVMSVIQYRQQTATTYISRSTCLLKIH